MRLGSCFSLFLSLSVDESRQSSIGNKTSYARLLILSSGYEFLGISSARAFNVSMALNGEYIYISNIE